MVLNGSIRERVPERDERHPFRDACGRVETYAHGFFQAADAFEEHRIDSSRDYVCRGFANGIAVNTSQQMKNELLDAT